MYSALIFTLIAAALACHDDTGPGSYNDTGPGSHNNTGSHKSTQGSGSHNNTHPAGLLNNIVTPTGQCQEINNVKQTYFGFPDNSPPGAAIAFEKCGHKLTGGTGTYTDPLTLSTANGELNMCEIVYSFYLRKYLRYENDCEACSNDWKNGIWHVDIWVGSATVNGGQDKINCEDSMTAGNQIILRNPPSDLPVDVTPLYSYQSNTSCRTDHTYTTRNESLSCLIQA
ncbi:hypothetical protein Egran_05820 [Elaphomyces granulatus]|uniref:Uncharacterized protein n=1 Tax=Elaphomyces granulatus TaxID=519963 RepID=A0A232LQL3_9EURO|nr:hypothetical protein Egran_05820 [Elaphomyces granulatus]